MKHCRATTCTVMVPPNVVMCARHWGLVPEELQAIILHGKGVEYVLALGAALTLIADAEGRDPFDEPMVRFSHRLKSRTTEEAA